MELAAAGVVGLVAIVVAIAVVLVAGLVFS